MIKFTKIFAFLIGILLTILWCVPLLLDFSQYKKPIIGQIEKFSNLKAELNGPLRIQILPSIKIKANQIVVKSNGGHYQKLLDIDSIHCHISLWKLLKGQFDLLSIEMIKPEIYADDKTIDNEEERNKKPTLQSPANQRDNSNKPSSQPSTFSLKNCTITDGKVTFFDTKSKSEYVIKKLQVQMRPHGEICNMVIQGDYDTWQLQGDLKFRPEIVKDIFSIQAKLNLKNNKLSCGLFQVEADIMRKSAIKAQISGMDIKIPFKVELPYKTIDFEKSSKFNAKILAGVPEIQINNFSFFHPDFTTKGQIHLNLDSSKWLSSTIACNIGDSEINSTINSQRINKNESITYYELKSNTIKNFSKWICKENYPLFDQPMTLKGSIELSLSKIKASPIELRIVNNTLKGSLEVNKPSYKINLHTDAIEFWLILLNEKPNLNGTLKLDTTVIDKKSGYDIKGFVNLIGKSQDTPNIDLTLDLKNFLLPQNQPLYMQSNLNGQANFKIKSWLIKGLDLYQITQTIKNPRQLIDPKIVGQLFSGKGQTLINTISGDFVISKGIATTKNINCNFADGNCSLKGTLDLPNWRLGFNGTLGVNKLPEVPFFIKGRVDDPSFQLDISSLLLKHGAQILKELIPSFIR